MDWDSAQIPVLADLPFDGSERKLLLTANRDGFFYVLDRTNGELLLAKPFVNTTWAREIGDDGRPVELPDSRPTEQGTSICPDVEGATNWMSPSFNPDTGLFYVTVREGCATYFSWKESFAPGQPYFGGGTRRRRTAASGMLRARVKTCGTSKLAARSPQLRSPISSMASSILPSLRTEP